MEGVRWSSSGKPWWLARVNCQLSLERALVGGPRFSAGDIGAQVRVFVQNARRSQPEQHRHHHQVPRAERPIEPVGITKATGQLAEPVTDAILDEWQALRGPGLVGLEDFGGYEVEDRRLHRAERGEHPGD